MSRIVILRHGNTFEPDESPRRIGARTDLPLTAEGRAQARRAAAQLIAAGNRFAEIRTSPLRRTYETAAILADACVDPVPVIIDDSLIEIDHGPDEGQSEAAVLARIGAEALEAWDTRLIPPPGWRVDAERRIAWWRAILVDGRGDRLFVTSNGTARFALAAIPARPPTGLKLRTGAWGEIVVTGGTAEVRCWNERPPATP